MNIKRLQQILGPGLLYAAAAIGVSHLVQSTRAGASFGPILILAVIICHIVKYPFFKIGPLYTHKTKTTVLQGYKKVHPSFVPIFILMTLLTMFIIQAAVTIVTAGIFVNILSLKISPIIVSCILLIITGLILQTDKYKWLDSIVKLIIIVLTITTLASVLMSLTNISEYLNLEIKDSFSLGENAHILFLVALIGWMPAPMDIPVWHSLWTKAKIDEDGKAANDKEAYLDFSVGYFGTAILAIAFLLLGSLVMHGRGIEFSSSAATFAGQLIELYTKSLGNWSYPIIAVASFTTMFSTTLTCLDAFPRVLTEASKIQGVKTQSSKSLYKVWLLITIIGTGIILIFFTKNMKAMVDFATTLSFAIAPVYAFFNYKLMTDKHTPKELQITGRIKFFTQICLGVLVSFSIYYFIISWT